MEADTNAGLAYFHVAADIQDTLAHVRGVAQFGAMVLVKPLRPLGVVLALWKGLRSAASAYRRLPS